MGITAIDTNAVRAQSKEKKSSSLPGVGFADFMNASGSSVSTAVELGQGYQPAAVTSAAISGIAGVPGAFGSNASNSPYFAGSSSSGLSLGSSYGGGISTASLSTDSLGINGSLGISAPSQDFQEKQALFNQMNDANWEMLVAQVTVNEISRDFQARSNILKTKSDTELNAVRNMRA